MRKVLAGIDRRDLLGLVGLVGLTYGLETVLAGAGYAATGAVLVFVALRGA